MKRILPFAAAAIFLRIAPAARPDSPPFDLASAQAAALANNPSLAAARERLAQAAARLAEARADRWPSLSAQANASRVDVSDRNLAGSGAKNPEDWFDAELKASWLLFDGFRRENSVAAARRGRDSGQAAFDDARRLLIQSVAHAFLRVQLAREEERIALADLEFYDRLAADAEARLAAGGGSRSDLLGFQIRANDARAALIDSRRIADAALAALAELASVPAARLAEAPLAPLAPDADPIPRNPNPDARLAQALAQRPDLLRAVADADAALADARAARGDLSPKIFLVGSCSGQRSHDASFRDDDFGWSAGVAVSFDIFEGGRTRAKIAQADSLAREASLAVQSLRNAVEREILDASSALSAAQDQLGLQSDNLRLVLQNRDLVESEYRSGQSSFVRLNEAQRDLVAAESRLSRARANLFLARVDLDAAAGN